MSKDELVQVFGSQLAIARALGISSAAVSKWPQKIPLLRQYQLREIFPEKFPAQTNAETITQQQDVA